tara:strand:- start:2777 stop:3241 length:465 start_codon:yes stop_codon:yes gene_type:complete
MKKKLASFFNGNKYNLLIILLICIVLIFLMCGNYNLVEDFSLDNRKDALNSAVSSMSNSVKIQKEIKNNYSNEEKKRKDLLDKDLGTMVRPKNVVEGFLEGINNLKCSSNHSNLGVSGNKANQMVNRQCENAEYLKNKNRSVLAGKHERNIDYY